jgi:hypothetical protein
MIEYLQMCHQDVAIQLSEGVPHSYILGKLNGQVAQAIDYLQHGRNTLTVPELQPFNE